MFEDIVSNKYFVIALIIALIVVIYLYVQKKSCGIEGMRNVDLSQTSQELTEKPWTEDKTDDKYKSVNNKFDRDADENTRKKTGKSSHLKRTDESYLSRVDDQENIRERQVKMADSRNDFAKSSRKYVEYRVHGDAGDGEADKHMVLRIYEKDIPRPIDTRPDLSQCQPCVCPGDKKQRRYRDDSDSDK